MTARWGACAILAICCALLIGCRTMQPNVKPAAEAECLVEPPPENRYETAGYPKRAFDAPVDPVKRALEAKTNPGSNPMGRGMGGGGMMPGSLGMRPY